MADGQPAELGEVLKRLEDEIATDRTRVRNWSGNLKDEYRLKGKATGMEIAVQEIRTALNEGGEE